MIYFTSDPHYYHKNSLKFASDTRPFDTVDELNEALIERHNSVVSPDDTVYYLGDITWNQQKFVHEIFPRLNGIKHLVFGNHDAKASRSKEFIEIWDSTQHYLDLWIDKTLFVLCHYPIACWRNSDRGSIHLHGHMHGKKVFVPGRIMDVGVDTNNLVPYSCEEILDNMQNMPIYRSF